MRTCRYFAVWADGQVVAVVLGYKEARRISPHRAYRSFKTEAAAEAFRDYWNNQVAVKWLAEQRAEAYRLSTTGIRERLGLPITYRPIYSHT